MGEISTFVELKFMYPNYAVATSWIGFH